jgi:hypothetical protein
VDRTSPFGRRLFVVEDSQACSGPDADEPFSRTTVHVPDAGGEPETSRTATSKWRVPFGASLCA